MKKTLALFAFLIFALSSCSKDDDGTTSDASLLHKWYMEEFYLEGTSHEDGMTIHMSSTAVPGTPNSISTEFKADGSFYGQNAPMVAEIVLTGDVNMQQTMTMGSDLPSQGTYQRNGNRLIFNEVQDGEMVYTIEVLTTSKLVLTTRGSDQNPMDMENIEDLFIRVTFKR